MEEHKYLQLIVKLLKFLTLWQNSNTNDVNHYWKKLKSYYILLVLLPGFLPLFYDLAKLTKEEDSTLIIINIVMEMSVVIGGYYMAICFIQNCEKIKMLVNDLDRFRKYCDFNQLLDTDKRANYLSLLYLLSMGIGVIIYISVPFITKNDCEQHKTRDMIEYGIPCGIIYRYRLPFRFDYTPLYQIIVGHQIFLVFVVSYIVVGITVLIFGILYHTTRQLNNLRNMIKAINYDVDLNEVKKQLKRVIDFHQDIINYSGDINRALGSQMVLHLTLMSVILSSICFVVISSRDFTDSIRYAAHVSGAFSLLLIVCIYGQKLMDESTAVGMELYNTQWYVGCVNVRKDICFIIMRTQKPLTLNAPYLGVMCLATFLKVMSSAYSYFTLFINVKS